jgi:hypothetical protein
MKVAPNKVCKERYNSFPMCVIILLICQKNILSNFAIIHE